MIYWAPGPFVRSFILPVDPGDICPPQRQRCIFFFTKGRRRLLVKEENSQSKLFVWLLSHSL
jgi:hypothetical protein